MHAPIAVLVASSCSTLAPAIASTAWWDPRASGWIGAVGGITLGGLGAVIGTLAGAGKARPVVMAALAVMTTIGAVSLAVGIVALAVGQPYAVYYTLLLPGVVCSGVTLSVRPGIRRRYEQIELRKMSARDAQ